jgi:hypothetical protein
VVRDIGEYIVLGQITKEEILAGISYLSYNIDGHIDSTLEFNALSKAVGILKRCVMMIENPCKVGLM